MGDFDVFISYRHKERNAVRPLVETLRAEGLSVWFDERDIGDFASITGEIRKGLAGSKALLAWYSADYPLSRPCQMELTAAFIAAARDGDVRRRVMVVNPSPSGEHIYPIQLRDALFRSAPGNEAGVTALAKAMAAHVRRLDTSLGAVLPTNSPRQYPLPLTGSSRFVGRLPELWRVHAALSATENAIISGRYASRPAQVHGMGGVGKSLLAEEYALRFGAAYPGGVFWLRALGHDASRAPRSRAELEAQRTDEIARMAVGLGLQTKGIDPEQVTSVVARTLEERGEAYLWVIDDLPGDLGADDVRRWLAPHPLGRSLITTRSGQYGAMGDALSLDVLPPYDAYTLLTHRRQPDGSEEERAARSLCHELGFHALALDLSASALAKWPMSIAAFRQDIVHATGDELEGLVVKLADELPNGHEKSVAATLLRSFARLPEEGRDFLRLASQLAPVPIPFQLVQAAFGAADTSDPAAAQRRAVLALSQCRDTSLAKGDGERGATGSRARYPHGALPRTSTSSVGRIGVAPGSLTKSSSVAPPTNTARSRSGPCLLATCTSCTRGFMLRVPFPAALAPLCARARGPRGAHRAAPAGCINAGRAARLSAQRGRVARGPRPALHPPGRATRAASRRHRASSVWPRPELRAR